MKGRPFAKKFEKKSHNAEKPEGGTLYSRPLFYVVALKKRNSPFG